jgi:hypothetical protein
MLTAITGLPDFTPLGRSQPATTSAVAIAKAQIPCRFAINRIADPNISLANQLQINSTALAERVSSQRLLDEEETTNNTNPTNGTGLFFRFVSFVVERGHCDSLANFASLRFASDPKLAQDQIEDVDVGHRRAFEHAGLRREHHAVL